MRKTILTTLCTLLISISSFARTQEVCDADAGNDIDACETVTNVYISVVSMSGGTPAPRWTTPDGTGQFYDGSSTYSDTAFFGGGYYVASPQDIANGKVTIKLENSDAACDAGTGIDIITIYYHIQPTISVLPVTICSTTPTVVMQADTAHATSVQWNLYYYASGSFDDPSLAAPTYTVNASDAPNGYSIFSVSAYQAGCSTVTTYGYLYYNMTPDIYAGDDFTICSTANAELIPTIYVGTVTTHTWSSSGTGSFNNNHLQFPFYTPSAADITAGSVNITYTVSSDGCADVNDQLILSITPGTLSVNIPQDSVAYCVDPVTNEVTVPLNATVVDATNGVYWYAQTGSGSFLDGASPNTSYHSVYYESGATLRLRLYANPVGPCSNVFDEIKVYLPEPPAESSESTGDTICYVTTWIKGGEHDAAQNVSSITWTSSGNGNFSGSQNSPDQVSYTPSNTDINRGYFVITGTAVPLPGCGITNKIFRDTVTVVKKPTGVTVNAGPDIYLCSTFALPPLQASANFNTLLYTASWSHNVGPNLYLNSTTDPNTSGNIYFSGTDTLFWGVTWNALLNGGSIVKSSTFKAIGGNAPPECVVSDYLLLSRSTFVGAVKDSLSVETSENGVLNVLLNDQIIMGDTISGILTKSSSHGGNPALVILDPDRVEIHYINNTPYIGTDTLVYQIYNQCGLGDYDSIIVHVKNAAPFAVKDGHVTSVRDEANPVIQIDSLYKLLADYNFNINYDLFSVEDQTKMGAKVTYLGNGSVKVDYSTAIDFTGDDYFRFTVQDSLGATGHGRYYITREGNYLSPEIKPDDFVVVNAMSPDGDGLNDFLYIKGIVDYKTTVVIFNRWGLKVWEGENYDNNTVKFEGNSMDNEVLPEGTYFYVVKNENKDQNKENTGLHSGFLEIRRSKQ